MRFLRELATRRSEKSAQRRKEKQPSKKRSWEESPANVTANDTASWEDEEEDEFESVMDEIASWGENSKLTDRLIRRGIPVRVEVTGQPAILIADTAGLRTACGTAHAVAWGLKKSGKTIQMVGVGKQPAWESQPVEILWSGRSISVVFCVIEQDGFPPLLGIEDMRKLKME
eukprot:GHVO01024382.1.p1 GENE.GHVO01024382.1~~GHVO01024382.1.p1  ORF type:complete len:172 (+),score=19.57 GHVO01024382.1:265-780(+)